MPGSAMKNPLPPLSTIGILGGGQLGRMLAMAAAEMGYHVHIYCPEENSPAAEVARFSTTAKYDDMEAIANFARSVDVVTYEFENIPKAPVEQIAKIVNVFPSPYILATSQHRVLEKQAINAMGIATAPFAPVSSYDELIAATQIIGIPSVLKTARMGYDGKGQAMLHKQEDINKAWEKIGGNELILEGFINFKMEISVIVARDATGNIECYPPVQNIHKNHILSETIAPAPISAQLAENAVHIAGTMAEGLKLVGLIAVEMFVTSDDKIIVNEIAPRPHNSGHWTINAAITSQFEQTIRAVCGLPLGSPAPLCNARMLNLIGDEVNDWQTYSAEKNAKLHLYGKKETKAGRKMGHVTFLITEG
jgi:5-(carboxyamino)imidazole ribonucleotide synthase